MDDDERPPFQRVAWDDVSPRRRRVTTERLVLLVGVCGLLAAFLYDVFVARIYLVGEWEVAPVEWGVLLALVGLAAYGVVPALRRPAAVRRLWGRIRSDRRLLAALGTLGGVVTVGLVGGPVLGSPTVDFLYAYQPPLGVTAKVYGASCYGEIVQGSGITRYCQGSLYYPFGTNTRGQPLDYLVIRGARPAAFVLVFTAAFVVPLAAAVGVAAGLRGGRLDDLLMTYVDVQLSLPALFAYFLGYMYVGPSLLLLLVTFGLLSWGGLARVVRSEVLQRREAGHVRVARSLGASDRYLAVHHILPNVTNTLVPAVFHLFAILVLVEAGVAFLGLSDAELHSWGTTIAEGLTTSPMAPHDVWWISTVPALALTATVVACKVAGDGLRDALDPKRGDRQ